VPTFGAIKAVAMYVSGRAAPDDPDEHQESRHGLDRVRRWVRHLRHRAPRGATSHGATSQGAASR